MNPKKGKNRENLLNQINFINPALEYIFQIIINSRIKNYSNKNLIIKYQTNDNKLIDLNNYSSSENLHNFEYNIYIFFCREEIKFLSFIVENWKFKITLNPEMKEFNNDIKKKLSKKLHTFARSIQSLQCLLPLDGLIKDAINKNSDFSFQAQIYKESNIDMELEEEIKNEKRSVELDMKDDKFINIQLTVNYFTRTGIWTHQDNLKKAIDYNGYFADCYNNISKAKNFSKMNNANSDNNNVNNINEKYNEKNDDNEVKTNFSLICDEVANDNEIMFSNIIQNTIINKKDELLNNSDIEQIKKEINDKKNLNLEQLYSSCFDNIEDINCRKTDDEIFSLPNIMAKENALLNNVKYNYIFGSENQILEEIYEEMEGIEIKDLLRYPPKNKNNNDIGNLIIDNYMFNKTKPKKNVEFKDLVDDYFDIKHILINK